VYTHAIFTGALALAVLALAAAAHEQLGAAVRRTRSGGTGGAAIELAAPVETVAGALRARGYLPMPHAGPERRLVRHPWGYWGNVLLHAGLLAVVAASTVIAATQQRGVVHLVEGETFAAGGPWFAEESGLGAAPLVLPFSVRLDHLEYRFGPTYGIERVSSALSLLRPGAPPEPVRIAISDLERVEFGHAFRLEIRHGDRTRTRTILVPHPVTPDVPGLDDFRVLSAGDLLRAKYFVDADRRSFERFNPLLVLRVDGGGGATLGEATLRPGTEGTIGPYRFRLEKVGLWTRVTFARITGIGGVFAGFAIIALGGALHYFTPPREALLAPAAAGGTRLTWRAARFASFYAEELDELRAGVAGGARGA
jgi:hypothetical protein